MQNPHDTSCCHKPTLFITYDGLLDPLGGSQFLRYLHRFVGQPRQLHILSFEKRYHPLSGESDR